MLQPLKRQQADKHGVFTPLLAGARQSGVFVLRTQHFEKSFGYDDLSKLYIGSVESFVFLKEDEHRMISVLKIFFKIAIQLGQETPVQTVMVFCGNPSTSWADSTRRHLHSRPF